MYVWGGVLLGGTGVWERDFTGDGGNFGEGFDWSEGSRSRLKRRRAERCVFGGRCMDRECGKGMLTGMGGISGRDWLLGGRGVSKRDFTGNGGEFMGGIGAKRSEMTRSRLKRRRAERSEAD